MCEPCCFPCGIPEGPQPVSVEIVPFDACSYRDPCCPPECCQLSKCCPPPEFCRPHPPCCRLPKQSNSGQFSKPNCCQRPTPICCALPKLRQCRSCEIRGSILYTSCDCIRRNGLQHDCPRRLCQGRPCCLTSPNPRCCPSLHARRLLRFPTEKA